MSVMLLSSDMCFKNFCIIGIIYLKSIYLCLICGFVSVVKSILKILHGNCGFCVKIKKETRAIKLEHIWVLKYCFLGESVWEWTLHSCLHLPSGVLLSLKFSWVSFCPWIKLKGRSNTWIWDLFVRQTDTMSIHILVFVS